MRSRLIHTIPAVALTASAIAVPAISQAAQLYPITKATSTRSVALMADDLVSRQAAVHHLRFDIGTGRIAALAFVPAAGTVSFKLTANVNNKTITLGSYSQTFTGAAVTIAKMPLTHNGKLALRAARAAHQSFVGSAVITYTPDSGVGASVRRSFTISR